ncbi:uncharacterized protein PV09_09399 [Verruconis gallopava]|uniref:JmjC domain-containing protein n=1 Tax=Verruconis gallopava TaxID=253628 RepID=A0A0D1ZWF6_9PEZI|nr:uncharacterized protein PV09_09399 [Verruconis gallopava]KIV98827.1 hypothetical protein PV09_09399 [Verruconis gallopava]
MRPFRTRLLDLAHCPAREWSVHSFRRQWYEKQTPIKYRFREFKRLNPLPAQEIWVTPSPQSDYAGCVALNDEYLRQYKDTIVPIERTVWGQDALKWRVKGFERFEAPLEFFLDWTARKLADPDTFSPNETLYIAQCSISSLPHGLQEALPPPLYCTKCSYENGNDDDYDGKKRHLHVTQAAEFSPDNGVESSSIWVGVPPVETPLHKDPHSNFLVQLAGFKAVRLIRRGDGELMLAYAKREVQMKCQQLGPVSMSMRGEEMMIGPERDLMSNLVWGIPDARHFNQVNEVLEDNQDSQGISHVNWFGRSPVEDEQSNDNESMDVALLHGKDSALGLPEIEVYHATLAPGDAVFIPKGWYHSLRSIGSHKNGINLSANWWFILE